ncbi:hypothetical protein DL96DRAFT_1418555, partial [Flagelloscypha sp. PMI_526]
IHPRFHVSLLRPFVANDDERFPNRDSFTPYDYGLPDEGEQLVEEIVDHFWTGNKVYFKVRWSDGDVTEEPLEHVRKCRALDAYLTLKHAKSCRQL